jgi:hypothetical protein
MAEGTGTTKGGGELATLQAAVRDYLEAVSPETPPVGNGDMQARLQRLADLCPPKKEKAA